MGNPFHPRTVHESQACKVHPEVASGTRQFFQRLEKIEAGQVQLTHQPKPSGFSLIDPK